MATRRRAVASFLGSAKLAVGLMIYLGFVSFIGAIVPQGQATSSRVAPWVASHPQWEAVARALGMHSIFTAWYFLAGAALLAASTAVCSWRRTKVAIARCRVLRKVRADGVLLGRPDYSIPIDSADGKNGSAALADAQAALVQVGIRGSIREGTIVAASSPASVWGSAAFHWALVALFCTLAASALFRSEGLMGVSEGEGVKDAAAAYRLLTVGPLHSWSRINRTILLNQMRLSYVVGGMDRGASPEVSVLDARGHVLAKQFIYPNNALHDGSLTIHNSAWGLSTRFQLLDKDGASVGAASAILDFPSSPTGSTGSGDIELGGNDGQVAIVARVTVPLDRKAGVLVEGLPRDPRTRIELFAPDGKPVGGGGTLSVGEELALPDGSSLRLERVSYYARLSVVDDPVIPLLYVLLVATLLGMAFALLTPQQMVVVELSDQDGAPRLDVRVRLWANVGTTAEEVKNALTSAARGSEHGDRETTAREVYRT